MRGETPARGFLLALLLLQTTSCGESSLHSEQPHHRPDTYTAQLGLILTSQLFNSAPVRVIQSSICAGVFCHMPHYQAQAKKKLGWKSVPSEKNKWMKLIQGSRSAGWCELKLIHHVCKHASEAVLSDRFKSQVQFYLTVLRGDQTFHYKLPGLDWDVEGVFW